MNPRIALPAVVLGLAPTVAWSRQEPTERSTEQRLQELERQNRELLERLDAIEEAGLEGDGGESEFRIFDSERPGISFHYGDVRGTFRIFADLGFAYSNPEAPDQGHSAFSLGTVDLFGSIQLGEHVQILSETLIKKRGDDTGIEQERLWASWAFDDRLYVKFGVDHSPISHWNRIYHHGTWLFTTAGRPFLGQFEEGSGFLPAHYAGIEIGGTAPTCLGWVEYLGIVSNGRGPDADERQVYSDANDDKAFDLALGLAPTGLDPLRVGAAVHLDKIPEEETPGSFPMPRPMREQIATAYADWRGSDFEVLAEGGIIRHRDTSTNDTYYHRSGYVQVGYHCGDWTPYTRFDIRSMREGDPYFAEANRDLDRRVQLLGMRYDLHSNLAAKLELGLGRTERRRPSGDLTRDDLTTVEFQLAWVF